MYGLPERNGDTLRTKRDEFAAELIADSRWLRIGSWLATPVGVTLAWLGFATPIPLVAMGGSAVTALGLMANFVGSHWLARKNARDAYRDAIAQADES